MPEVQGIRATPALTPTVIANSQQSPRRTSDSISSSQESSSTRSGWIQWIGRAAANFFQFLLDCCCGSCRNGRIPDQTRTRSPAISEERASARTLDASSSRPTSSEDRRDAPASLVTPRVEPVRQRETAATQERDAAISAVRRDVEAFAGAVQTNRVHYSRDQLNRIRLDMASLLGTSERRLDDLDIARRSIDPQSPRFQPLVEEAARMEAQIIRSGLESVRGDVESLNSTFSPSILPGSSGSIDQLTATANMPVIRLNADRMREAISRLAFFRGRITASSDPSLSQLADQIQARMQLCIRATTPREYPAPPTPRICQVRAPRHQIEALQDLQHLNETPQGREYTYQIGNAQIKIAHGLLMNQLVNCLAYHTPQGELLTDDETTALSIRDNFSGSDRNTGLTQELTSFQEVQPGVRVPAGQAIFTRGHVLTRGEFHSGVVHMAAPSHERRQAFDDIIERRSNEVRPANAWRSAETGVLAELTRARINDLSTQAENLVSPQVLHDAIYNSLIEAHEHGETSIAIMGHDLYRVENLRNADGSESYSWYDYTYCIRADKAAQVISQALRHFTLEHPTSQLRDIRFICDGRDEFNLLYNVFRHSLTTT